jgi:hypothetical protein
MQGRVQGRVHPLFRLRHAAVDQLQVENSDTADLICVRSYATDGEAFLARSVLESAGIDVMVSPPPEPSLLPRSFGMGLPATDVYVRAEDLEMASQILTTTGPSSGIGNRRQ